MKEYKRENLIVTWEPDLCTHSENCWRKLPEVFKPDERPWVKINNSEIENIKKIVCECPSKALKIKEE